MFAPLTRTLIAREEPVLHAHDISMWGYIVLTALVEQPVRTQAALAQAINADKSRIISVLDELQERGLIHRQPHDTDRRVHLLSLTPRATGCAGRWRPASGARRRRLARSQGVDAGPPGARAKCSSSTDRATLLSNGDKIEPCGVPVSVSFSAPSSVRMPAFKNAFTSARTRLSPTRARTLSSRAQCEISSKQARMSPSTIHS